jgi:group I intron endonuclease
MKISGIYKIQSKIKPERIYIGSAVDMKSRWSGHKYGLKHQKHGNGRLQNHFNKYGESDLIFIIIEPCFPEFLTVREQYYIDTLKPFFNICKVAGSQLGMKHSDSAIFKIKEARAKQGNTRKGIPQLEGTRQILRELRKTQNPWPKGSHHSEETKRQFSIKRTGVTQTEESNLKRSKTLKGRLSPRKGMKDSDETRKEKRESRIAYFVRKRLEDNKNCA